MARTAVSVVRGGGEDPLRSGVCRRPGCAEPAIELGLCTGHVVVYRIRHGRRERRIAHQAAQNFKALCDAAVASRACDGSIDPDAAREWLWALGEHLAAHDIGSQTPHDEGLLRRAVLDALGDFAGTRGVVHGVA